MASKQIQTNLTTKKIDESQDEIISIPPKPHQQFRTPQTVSFTNFNSQSEEFLNLNDSSENIHSVYFEIEQRITDAYPQFPTFDHSKSKEFTLTTQQVLMKCADQLCFLFSRLNEQVNAVNNTTFNAQTITSGAGCSQDGTALYRTLHQQDESIRVLKNENEYLHKQVNLLRQENNQSTKKGKLNSSPQPLELNFSTYKPQTRSSSLQPAHKSAEQLILSSPSKLLICQPKPLTNENLLEVQFDQQQLQQTLRLKSETCQNLQKQLESQRRRFDQDLEKASKNQNQLLKDQQAKVEELMMDVAQRDIQLNTLKQQLDELLQARHIEMSYVVVSKQSNFVKGTSIKAKNTQGALHSLFKIDSEMDQILLDQGINIKKRNKKIKNDSEFSEISKSQIGNYLQNQIATAQIADEMIGELLNQPSQEAEQNGITVQDAKIHLLQMQSDFKLLHGDRLFLREQLSKLQLENEDLKLKFTGLLDSFQDYIAEQENLVENTVGKPFNQTRVVEESKRLVETLRQEIAKQGEMIQGLNQENRALIEKLQNQNSDEMTIADRQAEKLVQDNKQLKAHYEGELSELRSFYEEKLKLVQQRQRNATKENIGSASQESFKLDTLLIKGTYSEQKNWGAQQFTNQQQQLILDKMNIKLQEMEKLVEAKNKEILKYKMANEDLTNRVRLNNVNPRQSLQQQDSEGGIKRRTTINDLQLAVESIRSSLQKVRKAILAQNGHHIDFCQQTQLKQTREPLTSENEFMQEIKIQMQEFASLQLVMNEISLLTEAAGAATNSSAQKSSSTNYKVKRNADQMLKANNTSGIYQLLLIQITQSETLMQDNALLQRTIYKYETTLSEVDQAIKKPATNTEKEFRKIIAEQTKQIVQLQRDLQILKQNQVEQPVQDSKPDLQPALKEFKLANEELLQERHTFISVISELEGQLKECHSHLETAMQQITTLQSQEEQCQIALTAIAEIFEKKQIEQKYGLDLLCEFILDKVDRLNAKFEETKQKIIQLEQEKISLYERKVETLDQEGQSMKRLKYFYNQVVTSLLPRFEQLLDQNVQLEYLKEMETEEEQALQMLEICQKQMSYNLRSLQCAKEQLLQVTQKNEHLIFEQTMATMQSQSTRKQNIGTNEYHSQMVGGFRPRLQQAIEKRMTTALKIENEELMKTKTQISNNMVFSPLGKSPQNQKTLEGGFSGSSYQFLPRRLY